MEMENIIINIFSMLTKNSTKQQNKAIPNMVIITKIPIMAIPNKYNIIKTWL